MQRLEVSGAVRLIYGSLGVKRLRSSNCYLRLLPRLPVTFIPIFIFTSITVVEGSIYTKCDCWLEVSIRKVLRPATSTQGFLGFPVSISKC